MGGLSSFVIDTISSGVGIKQKIIKKYKWSAFYVYIHEQDIKFEIYAILLMAVFNNFDTM